MEVKQKTYHHGVKYKDELKNFLVYPTVTQLQFSSYQLGLGDRSSFMKS